MLKVLQEFVCHYLRNPNFRELYQKDQDQALLLRGANPLEKELIKKLNHTHLDRTALSLRNERYDKRRAEFEEFFHYLSKFTDIDIFFDTFVRLYPTGSVSRKEEMNRFVNFSKLFIKENNFPEILTELLDYCYRVTLISDTPRENREEAYRNKEQTINKDTIFKLLEPYEVVDYKYNLNLLVEEDLSVESILEITPSKTKFFIQKNYKMATSSIVLEIDDPEFFQSLSNQESLQTILSKGNSSEGETVDNIQYLLKENIAIIKA
ncbi:hypothetical protein ABES25_12755 [Bacillus gobiensis]|uniref:hypothetical protein n=1 Tax=Bacillus gobiensis TaxID=1441095 RepID=UPI003D1E0914